jgi:hypothetical protein
VTAADGNEALGHLVSLLNRHGLAYMLVGSYSSNAYGIPRATNDADIVVATLDATFELIGSSLGDGYQTESQLEFELITGTVRRKISFTPINFVLEIFQLSDDPFDQSRFKRRVEVQSSLLGGSVWLPTPEDVIVQKLRWSRPQDLVDAENVMIVQMDNLDWSYIYRWTDLHGTTKTVAHIRDDL